MDNMTNFTNVGADGAIRIGADTYWFTNAGAPTTAGTGFAGKGSLCSDVTNGNLYINAGTSGTPSWKLVTKAA